MLAKTATFLAREPLLPLAVAAVGGIFIADLGHIAPAPLAAFSALALASAGASRRPFPFLVLAAGAIFGFHHSLAVADARRFPFRPNLEGGENLRIEATGVITAPPASSSSGTGAARCTVAFDAFEAAGYRWPCAQRLPVRLRIDASGLEYGDRIRLSGLLEPLDGARVPGAFAADRFYYRALGACGEVTVHPGDRLEVLGKNRGNPVIAVAHRSRRFLERALTRGLEDRPESAALIKAMVLGSREDTPEEIEEHFRLSGAMHVFAVSGLHVGMFGLIVWGFLKRCRVPKRHAILLIVPAILFYAAVTGLRPSAVRAALMGAIVLAGFLIERRARLLNSLALAALVLLAADTQQVFLPGFQLSFAVLGSIALMADRIRDWLRGPWEIDPFVPRRLVSRSWRWTDSAIRKLAAGVAVSLTAWAGSAPFVGHHFQIVTPIAILSNLAVVPAAYLILGTATVCMLLSVAGLGFAAVPLNLANAFFARATASLAGLFASVPGGHFHVSPAALLDPPPPARLEVVEPNIGGMSMLLSRHPSRWRSAHWLIDPGTPDGFAAAVQPLLRHRAVNRLQAIVLSHGDYNHIGAAAVVIDRYRPGAVFESPLENRSPSYREILDVLERRSHAVRRSLSGGDRIPLAARTAIDVLYPPPDFPSQNAADDQCLVLLFREGPWRTLMTFDSGFVAENWLLANRPDDLRADVWIKGWHTTDHSGSAAFLDRVAPRAVIATDHAFPPRERIDPRWRDLLARKQAVLFNLTECGAVTLDYEPHSLTLTGFANGQTLALDAPSAP